MVDCRTSLVEPKNLPVRDMGVFIDFFPVDAFARSGWPTRARLKLANFANKAYCSAYVRDGSAPLGKVSKFAGLVTESCSMASVRKDAMSSLRNWSN